MNSFRSVFKKLETVLGADRSEYDSIMKEVVDKTWQLQGKHNLKGQDVVMYVFDKSYSKNNEFIFLRYIDAILDECPLDINHQDRKGNTLLMNIFSHYNFWNAGEKILSKYQKMVDIALENNNGEDLLEVTLDYKGYNRVMALNNLYFVLKNNKILKNGQTLLAEIFNEDFKLADILPVYKKVLSIEKIDKTLKGEDGVMAIEHIVRNINTFDFAKHLHEFYQVTRDWCELELEKQPNNIELQELAGICAEQEKKFEEQKSEVHHEYQLREQTQTIYNTQEKINIIEDEKGRTL